MNKVEMIEFKDIKKYVVKGGWETDPIVKFVEIKYSEKNKYGWIFSQIATHRILKCSEIPFPEYETLEEAEKSFHEHMTFFVYGDWAKTYEEIKKMQSFIKT